MGISFEKMQKNDYEKVMDLISEAWFSEYTFPKRTIELYKKGYLYMYLSELDYCVVAKDNGNTIGFIFGRAKRVNFFKMLYYKLKLFFVGFRMLFSSSGRRGIKITSITNKANRKLYKMSKLKSKAELVLFIVDEKYRQQGIGSKLEKDFCEYLRNNGESHVYLYTDTYSNYLYYENRGYERRGEINVNFKIKGEDDKPVYYIYAKEIDK